MQSSPPVTAQIFLSFLGQIESENQMPQDRPVKSEFIYDALYRARRGCWGWADNAIGHRGDSTTWVICIK